MTKVSPNSGEGLTKGAKLVKYSSGILSHPTLTDNNYVNYFIYPNGTFNDQLVSYKVEVPSGIGSTVYTDFDRSNNSSYHHRLTAGGKGTTYSRLQMYKSFTGSFEWTVFVMENLT